LRRWNDDARFKATYGRIFDAYRRITFDKAYAREHRAVEFVAPGHPLLEAVSETVLERGAGGADAYALFGDPEGEREGLLWFVEGAVNDALGRAAGKRVFCLHQDMAGELRTLNPAVLWNYDPLDGADLPEAQAAMLAQREAVEDFIITEVLFPYQAEIAARRAHEAQVKEKYGLRSLDYLIQESNQKILDYQLRQDAGEVMDLPLRNERRNLEQLEARRAALEREIRLESQLTVDEPRILGTAVVIPLEPEAAAPALAYPESKDAGQANHEPGERYDVGGMRRDDEAEAVGMRETMRYERAQGRAPEDVSEENLGFDVRSLAYHADGTLAGIRYIEVKARARSGAVRISSNEWKGARHFGKDFWLYIVTGAKTERPELHRIPNPAAQFRVGEEIEVTGYIIQEDAWRQRVTK
ncbi:MAG: DUF3883 domain-containing protein, partial [Chloroflexi bacterium]|nr:DUF3883 domain-containing protein [Chloroflexota bacterium]